MVSGVHHRGDLVRQAVVADRHVVRLPLGAGAGPARRAPSSRTRGRHASKRAGQPARQRVAELPQDEADVGGETQRRAARLRPSSTGSQSTMTTCASSAKDGGRP